MPAKCPDLGLAQERIRAYQRRLYALHQMRRTARRAAAGNQLVYTTIMTAYLNATRSSRPVNGGPEQRVSPTRTEPVTGGPP